MASQNLPMWLLLVLLPLLLLLKKMKQNKTLHKRLPPSPPRLPVLGNLHQIGALPHQCYKQLSEKYGPVMLLKFGAVPVIIFSSAEAAREVLKVHDLNCCTRPRLTGTRKLTYNYSSLAFSEYGDYWREIRKICVLKLFSLKSVHSFRSVREEEVAILVNSISQSSSSSSSATQQPVDISEKMYSLTGSIILRMAFGKKFRGSNFDNNRFKDLIHAASALQARFTAEECFPYVGWIVDRLTGYHSKLNSVFQELDNFFEQVIADHAKAEKSKQEEEDIIDYLLNLQKDQNESCEAWIKKDHIKALLLDIFLAGVDTSAITVIWALTELVRNPRMMSKAQDEVRNCVGKKGSVTEADIEQLNFLKMTIKETLRLHPSGPLLLPREIISHFRVYGYDICPKTIIQVNAWAIAKDPKYWKKPEEFYPERFMDHSINFNGQNFEYLPFGSGRRSCPGMHVGMKTVELALANLLYHFDWKLPNGMQVEDINMEESNGLSLTVSKKTALNLVPVNYLK